MAEPEARRTARGLLVVAREQSYLTQAVLELLEGDTARPEEGRGSEVMSSTVDSTPTEVGPPSRRSSIRPSRSSRTCSAHVGLGRPERLAEGAAMGREAAWMRAWATGWAGTRTATVSSPPVVTRGTARARGSTRVSGPGQKRRRDVLNPGGHLGGHVVEGVDAGQVNDEGVASRPLLGLEDPCHRRGGEGIGAETVHGLRGEGHEAPRANHLGGATHRLRVRPQILRAHGHGRRPYRRAPVEARSGLTAAASKA